MCKQTFSDRVVLTQQSFTDKRLRFSRANELSPREFLTILNKTVIFFLLATISAPERFPRRASTPPPHRFVENLSRHHSHRDISVRRGINSPPNSGLKSSLRIFRLFNDRENRPLCGTGGISSFELYSKIVSISARPECTATVRFHER